MKTICLDLDDFSVLNNRMDLLLRLKESYPKLKVSLFTIPFEIAREGSVEGRLVRDEALAMIKKQLDWIEIIPHGLTHMPREFKRCDYGTMKNYVIPSIDEAFKKDGLPYVKGFKAPQWLWNKEVVRALDEKGWWGAIDKNPDPKTWVTPTKKFYVFNHGIDEWFSESNLPLLKLHGHITGGLHNSIDLCFTNLFRMPTDAEFKFASELVKTVK